MTDVRCGNCNLGLNEDFNLQEDQRKPCPRCGSLSRYFHKLVTDEINLHEKNGLKAKHGSGGKPFFESVCGSDLHRKSSTWMKFERTIDRDNDHYREVVINPNTEEVVHFCEEPLSEHQGHGAAKHKKEK